MNKEICYEEHTRTGTSCVKSTCRYNFSNEACQNCVLIASSKRHTLQEIGDIYGVTRMRICQIEKKATKNLGEAHSSLLE
ncbi:MAG: hypothetical protein CMA72_09620 [Euryarchaeota archaeon]|nr:hypothetical protein [Euryarchaeota archaeon]